MSSDRPRQALSLFPPGTLPERRPPAQPVPPPCARAHCQRYQDHNLYAYQDCSTCSDWKVELWPYHAVVEAYVIDGTSGEPAREAARHRASKKWRLTKAEPVRMKGTEQTRPHSVKAASSPFYSRSALTAPTR